MIPGVDLAFAPHIGERERARIGYAFRTFCAFWGYRVGGTGACAVVYGADLPAVYHARNRRAPVPPPVGRDGPLPLRYVGEGGIDWLGELFEWISGHAEEAAEAPRDPVGRVSSAGALDAIDGVPASTPWANRISFRFNRALRRFLGSAWLSAPRSPWSDGLGFALEASHDVDHVGGVTRADVARLAKNAAAAVLDGDPALAFGIAAATGRSLIGGTDVLDRLLTLRAGEQRLGAESDFPIISGGGHRRDARYRPDQPRILARLRALRTSGAELAVHGSYASGDAPGSIAEEYASLRSLGFSPRGGRQHWLRFRDADHFAELVRAGARWDGTIGFPDRPGFRRGAAFPFRPYDWRVEAAHPLIELPMVLMDVALQRWSRRLGRDPWPLARDLMAQAQRWGWGGIGILWHNTAFGGGQLPRAVADCYWRLIERHRAFAGGTLQARLEARFAAAGLAVG